MDGISSIGSLLGSIIRARPQTNPEFLQQVNSGLTPSVNPYLEPTSQLKRVFGNNADDLNMAYAATTGRGILETRDAMQKMQEANRLAEARDRAQAELQSQADYDDFTLQLALDAQRNKFTRERDDATLGTPEFREKKRRLDFKKEKLSLQDQQNDSGDTRELRKLEIEKARRVANEDAAEEAFKLAHPELMQQSFLNKLDPAVPLGTGDSRMRLLTGQTYYGPVPVETPGPVDQYGRQGPATRRWTQPPSIGPNPAVYPGSMLKQNRGGMLQTGDVQDTKLFLQAPSGSSLRQLAPPDEVQGPEPSNAVRLKQFVNLLSANKGDGRNVWPNAGIDSLAEDLTPLMGISEKDPRLQVGSSAFYRSPVGQVKNSLSGQPTRLNLPKGAAWDFAETLPQDELMSLLSRAYQRTKIPSISPFSQ